MSVSTHVSTRMFPSRAFARRIAVTGAAGLATLALAACSGVRSGSHQAGSSTAPSAPVSATAPAAPPAASASASAGDHNATDVSFAQGMIPHHRQAVAMAELAAERASSAQVKELAAKIKGAQDPEITMMSGWLTGWGNPVPDAGVSAAMPGMDHSAGSGHPMPGMMADDEMAKLRSASGADFDKAFLTMMVTHHQGAVTMAADELAKGAYPPARTLAGSISTAQTAEIAEMEKLLSAG
ncbi:DUF305 domain-containing protein [Kitasatospora sp. NPDC001175]|uniref:DUF305 domain-containing protein n=1 Tax=Kitasatospora sp. NPDC001175 TaxID=3157103 RepID=UPI003D04FAD6